MGKLRRRAARVPGWLSAFVAIPSLAWASFAALLTWAYVRNWGGYSMYGHLAGTPVVEHLRLVYTAYMTAFVALLAVPVFAIHAATRAGARAFLAPTLDAEDTAPVPSGRRVTFDAVAVTRETRAAVLAMAVLPVFAVLALLRLQLSDGAALATFAAYAATAIGGTFAFRRASRVAVGVDGIFIAGSSRSRFFSYRDVDGVRARGAVVASASDERLARLARGGAGYRASSVSRDQLWSVVESPEHDAASRTAAAKALVLHSAADDRQRLRAAAGRIAQPELRIRLSELADAEGEEDDGLEAPLRRERRA
jgi:hypothetical protein